MLMVTLKLWLKRSDKPNSKNRILKVTKFTDPIDVELVEDLDGQLTSIFKGKIEGSTTPSNKPPVVNAGENVTVKPGTLVVLDATAEDSDGTIKEVQWIHEGGLAVVLEKDPEDITKASFTAPDQEGTVTFAVTAKDDQGATATDRIVITVSSGDLPPPPPPTGEVLFDSHRDTKLHDGKVRTVKQEGSITPNGLGIECHASGSPKVVVNEDGTFSLLCSAGHGRFYGFVLNYDSTLEIEAAFWNDAPGQDCSLKVRSRHNEGGAGENRFGGYGLSVDRTGYDAKREIYHNVHDESKSGSLPEKIETQKYFKIRFTVKDDGSTVKQIGELNGKQFMDKVDTAPKPYMVDKGSFAKQSYYWVRQNLDSGNGELRIKSIRILKA